MSAMTTVVKQMHQGAGKQEKQGQCTQQMRAVLGEQKEAGDGQEADQRPVAPRTFPAGILLMVFMRHGNVLLIW
jgi:hypothetical protein